MTVNTLVTRAEAFYKLAISNKKKALVFNDPMEGDSIVIVDQSGKIKAALTVVNYNGLKTNNALKDIPLKEMTTIVSSNAIEALQLIVLAWKLFGAVVPDQGSVSGSAAAMINNYFSRVSNDPKLVQPLLDFGPPNPLKTVYLPNPEYYHLADTLDVEKVNDSELIHKLHEQGSDLFGDKYKLQKEIINNFGF